MTAFAEIDKDTARSAAVSYLQAREKRIERDREKSISWAMQEPTSFWKFFGKKARTREEAIIFLKQPGSFGCSIWIEPEWRGYSNAEIAQGIINLADKAATQTITLGTHEIHILRKHWHADCSESQSS